MSLCRHYYFNDPLRYLPEILARAGRQQLLVVQQDTSSVAIHWANSKAAGHMKADGFALLAYRSVPVVGLAPSNGRYRPGRGIREFPGRTQKV